MSSRSHPDNCQHEPELIKVAMAPAARSWSAVCVGCLGHWIYTDTDVPENVRDAVHAAAQFVASKQPRPRAGSLQHDAADGAPHRFDSGSRPRAHH